MSEIRGLTVRQPWAWAIAHGRKTIENRSWDTRYRGLVAIHAAAGMDSKRRLGEAVRRVAELAGLPVPHVESGCEVRGRIIAVARLAEVCSASLRYAFSAPLECGCGPWAMSSLRHWRLVDVRPLAEPVEAKGALGLWRLPADVEAAVRADRLAVAHG